MKQMEILKKWLLQEKIHFEYNYEPLFPDMTELIEEYEPILNEEMKLLRNQIVIRFENDYEISIICQFNSMGVRQGLLEYWIMGKDEEPVGYCTAEEVIEIIKEWVKKWKIKKLY